MDNYMKRQLRVFIRGPVEVREQISEFFIQQMVNRMVMGYFRYGPFRQQFPHRADAYESLRARLRKYKETGNTEWLIDVANLAMMEFECPSHENAHYDPNTREQSPGQIDATGNRTKDIGKGV